MTKQYTTELAVIGAGPGGYAAAFLAADSGMQVTLIDPEMNPGGVCLYRGCIPSKALLHVAKLLNETKQATHWGLRFEKPTIDLEQLREWKNSIVQKITSGTGQLVKQRKITLVRGHASFSSSTTLFIQTHDGSEQELQFQHAILATGSRPATIPGIEISSRVMDSTGALELNDIPSSLLVVGGGYIGLELGSVYAALGSKVTVVEMTAGLLPGADRDLVTILAKQLAERFESILLNIRVSEMRETKKRIEVTLNTSDGEVKKTFEKALISIGRKPNTTGLGLENTNVAVNDRGFVLVDPQMRTADTTIFAIGDIVGEPQLAHKASHEGRVAVEAIAGHKVVFEPLAIPAVVFTDPEIAWAGITETQAKEKGIEHKVVRFPWAASGRALTLDRTDGVTKMIIDPATERILGIGLCGSGAGELISETVLALEMGAIAKDVALSIHPHPTLSETIMESAEVFYGTSTHVYRPKR